jgi:hypothetical protein
MLGPIVDTIKLSPSSSNPNLIFAGEIETPKYSIALLETLTKEQQRLCKRAYLMNTGFPNDPDRHLCDVQTMVIGGQDLLSYDMPTLFENFAIKPQPAESLNPVKSDGLVLRTTVTPAGNAEVLKQNGFGTVDAMVLLDLDGKPHYYRFTGDRKEYEGPDLQGYLAALSTAQIMVSTEEPATQINECVQLHTSQSGDDLIIEIAGGLINSRSLHDGDSGQKAEKQMGIYNGQPYCYWGLPKDINKEQVEAWVEEVCRVHKMIARGVGKGISLDARYYPQNYHDAKVAGNIQYFDFNAIKQLTIPYRQMSQTDDVGNAISDEANVRQLRAGYEAMLKSALEAMKPSVEEP